MATPAGSAADAPEQAELAARAMREVYSDWGSAGSGSAGGGWAPIPLPAEEAGSSPSGQRRYLWIDAFGVLNFVSLAEVARQRARGGEGIAGDAEKGEAEAQRLLGAAAALISEVHGCLGAPRSPEFPMREAADGGYEGLRIGKERARMLSDPGMEFDGMYWHYIDKWIFALARFARAAGDTSAVRRGLRLARQVHPRFLARGRGGEPLGLYWKMNVDLTIIEGCSHAGLGDAVAGLVAYVALERARAALGLEEEPSLGAEIADLKAVVRAYASAGGFRMATQDPLGFGLQYWEAQFLPPQHADALRRELRSLAPAAIDARHFGLPFRLYGALIGGRLSGDPSVEHSALELLAWATPREMTSRCGEAPHSGINKVMLATALLPSTFARREDEAAIEF